MLRGIFFALIPLGVLVCAIVLACIAGYFIMLGIDSEIPLRKIISKSTQFFLVLSIFPAMHYLSIRRLELGFAERRLFFAQLAKGFCLGFITLMPVFVLLTLLGVNVVDHTQTWTWAVLLQKSLLNLLMALVISWIEEPLFRGILLVGLAKKIRLSSAILISAFYYAILHFLETKTNIPREQLTIWSGFELLGEASKNLWRAEILPAFFALLMVGIFLGVLRTRISASLGWCIGCHTCWVWLIKMNKNLFDTDFSSEYAYLVSRYDGVIGPLVSLWLLVVVAGYLMLVRARFQTTLERV